MLTASYKQAAQMPALTYSSHPPRSAPAWGWVACHGVRVRAPRACRTGSSGKTLTASSAWAVRRSAVVQCIKEGPAPHGPARRKLQVQLK